ncbi:long-chain fatty acid--CoA ligase [Vineibacter terrae]|uniref:Long-chain fatty acid--CoA ligase n=1 Tax=Vineibacter terrae TaxID=2586908 RepID=A0A5C8P9C9_9HYPH|nr:AMP-binding protein [Vineibacter terrae]TXL70173.1 long-chain fatty acid--CoA ligase [Vineibacter terrae]
MDMLYTRALFLNARRYPRKPAIVFAGEACTYAQLYDRVARLGALLAAQGVGAGDRVSLLSENHPDMLAVMLAALGLGASPAPINYRLKDDDIAFIARNSAAKVVVLGPGYGGHADLLSQALPQARLLSLGPAASGAAPDAIDTLIAAARPLAFDWTAATNLALLHTSGTTGRPKGALRARWGLSARAIEQGFTQDDRTLGVMPLCLSYGYGYSLLPLYLGATLYLEPDFDEQRVAGLLEAEGINSTFMIPTLVQRLVDYEGFASLKCPSLRLIQNAAGALSYETRAAVVDKLGYVLSTYAASTESGPYANLKGRDILRDQTASGIGRTFFGSEVRLLDDDGHDVATGAVGEICVRGASQYDEYLNEPELTAETRRGDMVSVGDLGRFDDEGFLFLVGRKRDIIKTGGINVPAADVEDVIARHPAVAEVACVGLPDRAWGEMICAAIVLRPGSGAPADIDVAGFCTQRLSRFQVPRRFVFLPSLPRNLTGKVVKGDLRNLILGQDAAPDDGRAVAAKRS